jgi:hypothetical protein
MGTSCDAGQSRKRLYGRGLMGQIIPDSAVAIDTTREEQPFRSKADGLLPPSGYRSALLSRYISVPRPHQLRI